MEEKRKWIKKSDFILICIFFILAGAVYIGYNVLQGDSQAKYAEILINGEVIKKVSLSQDKIFSVPEKENIKFEIKDGGIRFKESDCPDKICVHTGFIKNTAQTAVCLPNGISVRTINENEIDAVVG